MKCRHCTKTCIKKGKIGKTQRYLCKNCNRYQQDKYIYNSYLIEDREIIKFTKEGLGIRSISRLLDLSPTTVITRTIEISRKLVRNTIIETGQTYQVDELFTYIGNKDYRVCIAYSFDPRNKKVIDIVVGRRNKTNLRKIINTLVLSNARRIITDKLNIYKELIPKEIHSSKHRGINHIERQNLTLRTHLKRLNRRTICYSKSLIMLLAVVKIYFWG